MPNKVLIAVITCNQYKGRADAQRSTWIKDISGIDYKFFLGRGNTEPPREDEIFLDVPDDYDGLPWKVQAVMKWAVEQGYDAVFKCDDDTFVFPEKLLTHYLNTPYEGRINTSNRNLAPNGWCSGFAYWLSGTALEIIANSPPPTNKAEDLWVGITLNQHGITPTIQKGFLVLSMMAPHVWRQHKDSVVAACEFRDWHMVEIDKVMKAPLQDSLVVPTPNGYNNRGIRVVRFGDVLRRRR